MSKTKNSEGSSVLSIDNLSKEYTQQLQGLLISGHQDAMSMALFSVETFLNEQANKNLFITDLLIDFENNCTVKILSYTTKAPDKWKTKSLASFLHRAWEGIGSMGILIYRVRVSLGNAVQFDVGEDPKFRSTCFNLQSYPKSVDAEYIAKKQSVVMANESYL
jgi:hypothetical protein